jgi:TonB-dependent starch-binding outer membrane protein SusC
MKIKSESKLRIRQFLFSIFLCSATMLFAQQGTIKGKIADSKGDPIIGANVLVEGTSIGAISDINGEYTLTKVPAGTVQLSVKYIGYLSEALSVNVSDNQTTESSFVLIEDLQQLSEVVVIGYGTVKKSDLIGAVASVTVEDMQKIPNTGVSSMLQGMAAGVQVIPNSGQPGSQSTIRVRGLATVNGGNPLIVIDGIPGGSLNDLNPSDIESIEILKDAASQSIYGAAGGNGVILVTTKKGAAGKFTVKFDMYAGFSQPWKKDINICDAQQYAEIYNLSKTSVGGNAYFIKDPNTGLYLDPTDSLALTDTKWTHEIFRKAAFMHNYNLSISGGNKISKFYTGFNYNEEEGTLHKTSNRKYTFRLNSDHTLFKIITVGENFNVTQAFQKNQGERNEYGSPLATSIQMLPVVPIYAPDSSGNFEYRGAGLPSNVSNPVAQISHNNNINKSTSIDGNVFIRINILKGLTFESNYGMRHNPTEYRQFTPIFDIGSIGAFNPSQSKFTNEYDFNSTEANSWTWQNFFNYNVTLLDQHNFAFTLGTESGYYKYEYKNRIGNYDTIPFAFADWREFSSADTMEITQQKMTEQKSYAYFFRVNYDWAGILLLQANIRRDYSSKFGPNKRVGNFPSISAGLKFSEFDFVKNLNIIDFGKIRVGYGETGNSDIQPFQYLSSIAVLPVNSYPIDGTISEPGAGLITAGNPDLSWETVVTKNIGIDLRFLRNRLSLSFDLFKRENQDMLLRKSVPLAVGYFVGSGAASQELGDAALDTRPLVNYGTLDNKGFEITLSYKDQIGKLKYDFNVNFTRAVTKIKDIGDPLYGGSGRGLANVTQTQVDGPVSAFYGYKTNGVYTEDEFQWYFTKGLRPDGTIDPARKWKRVPVDPNGGTVISGFDQAGNAITLRTMDETAVPGDPKFMDTNGDSIITALDWVQIGDPNPDFTYGFGLNLEYANFDFSMFWQGSYGNDVFNLMKVNSYNTNNGNLNYTYDLKDAYIPALYDEKDKTGAAPPVIADSKNTTTGAWRLNPDLASSDFYVEDGTYLRLKNIQLGYTLPISLTQKFKAEKLRIYVSARNLLTFTKYAGFDPEVGENTSTNNSLLERGFDRGTYPQSKTYTIGLSLIF